MGNVDEFLEDSESRKLQRLLDSRMAMAEMRMRGVEWTEDHPGPRFWYVWPDMIPRLESWYSLWQKLPFAIKHQGRQVDIVAGLEELPKPRGRPPKGAS